MPCTNIPNVPAEEWEFLHLALLGGREDPLHPEVAAFTAGLQLQTGQFDLWSICAKWNFDYTLLTSDVGCRFLMLAWMVTKDVLISTQPLLDIHVKDVVPYHILEIQLGVTMFGEQLLNFFIEVLVPLTLMLSNSA